MLDNFFNMVSKTSQKQLSSEQRAKIFAALADPIRLKIVELLAGDRELSSSEIAEKLGISLALCCHHTKILAESGAIEKRKEGITKYNSLNRSLLNACGESLIHLG